MLPKKISLKDDQFVVLKDTINHISFYPSSNCITYVILPNAQTDLMYYVNNIVNILKSIARREKMLSSILSSHRLILLR